MLRISVNLIVMAYCIVVCLAGLALIWHTLLQTAYGCLDPTQITNLKWFFLATALAHGIQLLDERTS